MNYWCTCHYETLTSLDSDSLSKGTGVSRFAFVYRKKLLRVKLGLNINCKKMSKQFLKDPFLLNQHLPGSFLSQIQVANICGKSLALSSHRSFQFCINAWSIPSPPSCFQAWLQWIACTDEALVLLCTLWRRAELPYYSSISSQQSLPIQVIRQQSACLGAYWSRKIGNREGGGGQGRWREETGKAHKRGGQDEPMPHCHVEDSIKKRVKKMSESQRRNWEKHNLPRSNETWSHTKTNQMEKSENKGTRMKGEIQNLSEKREKRK